jgi:hypothetical protein
VFGAIHDGAPDQALLSYQYLQMLPQLAQGDANKIFVIPSEFSQALGGLADRFASATGANGVVPKPKPPTPERLEASEKAAADAAEAARAARAASEEASAASNPGATHEVPPPEVA